MKQGIAKRLKSCLVIFLFVILGNTINIFITNPNPIITRSGLGISKETLQGKYNGTEVNDGPITHSLGTASVHQILEGNLPLWNHYEGVGAPLAGDMQPASLFVPFNLLLALPAGFLIFRIVLETLAGIGMYVLLRRLKLSNGVATVGGMLFSLSSLFAIFGSALVNPVPFFPWQVYALERMRDELKGTTDARKKFGWIVLALSLALSLYAGFPETAYINGLLVAAWFVYRLVGFWKEKKTMAKYFMYVLGGGIVGLILAAPILYLFAHYLISGANIGGHTGAFAGAGLKDGALPMLVFPYVYGLIYEHPGAAAFWSSLGGFVGISIITTACIGLRNTAISVGMRLFFLIISAVAVARVLAVPVITQLVDKLPLMSSAAPHRYIPPLFVFSLIILAAFGLEYVWKQPENRSIKKIWLAIITGGLIAAGVLFAAQQHMMTMNDTQPIQIYLTNTIWLTAAGFAIIILFASVKQFRVLLPATLVLLMLAETATSFLLPQLGAPVRSQVKMDFGVVEFLQQNLGNQRFYFIGNEHGLKTNYGSYFKLASINTENLPTPKLWEEYVHSKLDNNTSTISFSGAFREHWNKNSVQDEFVRNFKNYQAIGVKYIISEPDGPYRLSIDQAAKLGLKGVYINPSKTAVIYQTPSYSPYTEAEGCQLTIKTRNEITADCKKESELIRRELFFDGWSVSVNNQGAEIAKKDDLFQAVRLPKGKSHVKFTFWPKHTTLAFVAAAVALTEIIVATVVLFFIRPKQDDVTSHTPIKTKTTAAHGKNKTQTPTLDHTATRSVKTKPKNSQNRTTSKTKPTKSVRTVKQASTKTKAVKKPHRISAVSNKKKAKKPNA